MTQHHIETSESWRAREKDADAPCIALCGGEHKHFWEMRYVGDKAAGQPLVYNQEEAAAGFVENPDAANWEIVCKACVAVLVFTGRIGKVIK